MLMHLSVYSEPPPGGQMRTFQLWIFFKNEGRNGALRNEPPPGGHKRAFLV